MMYFTVLRCIKMYYAVLRGIKVTSQRYGDYPCIRQYWMYQYMLPVFNTCWTPLAQARLPTSSESMAESISGPTGGGLG